MKIKNFLRGLVLVLAASLSMSVYAQKPATLIKKTSLITIKGTSSLHNWEEKISQFDCALAVETKAGELVKFGTSQFVCNAKSIESGNSLMNSKTYEALKAKDNPQIKFVLKKVENTASKNGNFSCIAVGDISIAGVTKAVAIPVNGTIIGNVLAIKGSTNIKLADFKMNPPTALMGTIKVGPEVTVAFAMSFAL